MGVLHARWCFVDLDAGRVEPLGPAGVGGWLRTPGAAGAGGVHHDAALLADQPSFDARAEPPVVAAACVASCAEQAAVGLDPGQAGPAACAA